MDFIAKLKKYKQENDRLKDVYSIRLCNKWSLAIRNLFQTLPIYYFMYNNEQYAFKLCSLEQLGQNADYFRNHSHSHVERVLKGSVYFIQRVTPGRGCIMWHTHHSAWTRDMQFLNKLINALFNVGSGCDK